ncbi:unnamed protein product [Euphydryas editha]|uniref:THAP-type domain-containing protein n=1 Tax=Euphydryas editha TaxID=104508 RepID=A0AAU9UD66_EUPED|nr:unnamed protein product [Euphydryas editha]
MPRCSVPKCSEMGTHKFSRNKQVQKLWLKAIRCPKSNPSNSSRLCRNHFLETDYLGYSRDIGLQHRHRYLKKNAVPSQFSWNHTTITILFTKISKDKNDLLQGTNSEILSKADKKLANQRVHIKRLIGLTKSYAILKTELNQFYVPSASKIFFICFMLCNFKEGIVSKNKK